MADVAGAQSTVGWGMTFGFVLLPGAVVGGLLGLAEYRRRTGNPRGRGALALAPFAFAAVLMPGVVQDPARLFTDGIGGGALALPALGVIGGYAVAGQGSLTARLPAAVVAVGALLVWPFVGVAVGGTSFAPGTPHGLWATLLYDALLVVLMLGASIPHHQPWRSPSVTISAAASPAGMPGVG